MRLVNTGEREQSRIHAPEHPAQTADTGQVKQKNSRKESIREKAEHDKLELSEAALEMLQKQAEENRKAEEKSGDAPVDLGKIMEIARRIARGDSVPPRDEKKLMEYSVELYQMAKSAAMLSRRKKHKKHKSLFDEEEGGTMEEKMRKLLREDDTAGETAVSGGSETGNPEETGA